MVSEGNKPRVMGIGRPGTQVIREVNEDDAREPINIIRTENPPAINPKFSRVLATIIE